METPKAKKHHSKKLLIALIFLVLLAGAGIGVWLLFFQDRGDSGQVMYREYTVARGDLTIGLSESGTVSLSREIISQPVDVTVTDISVAVGDHVAEGDIVAVLSEASVQKTLANYDLQLSIAENTYAQAQLDAQTKIAQAKLTYESALLKGKQASSQNLTEAQAENDLASAERTLENAKTALSEFQQLYQTYADDYTYLQELEIWKDDAAQSLADYKAQLTTFQDYSSNKLTEYSTLESTYKTSLSTYNEAYLSYTSSISTLDSAKAALQTATELDPDGDHSALQAVVDNAQSNYDSAHSTYLSAQSKLYTAQSNYYGITYTEAILTAEQESIELTIAELTARSSNFSSAYTEFKAEFDEKYGDSEQYLKSDLLAAQRLQTLQLSVENAQFSLEKAQITAQNNIDDAGQTKSSAQLTASTAKETYDLSVQAAQNTLQSAKETYEATVETINTAREEFAQSGELLAPCTGTVVAVGAEAGDTIAAGQSIITILNTAEAFVTISVSEEDITEVSTGMEATIELSSYEGQTFDGVVSMVAAEPSRSGSASVTFNVTVQLLDTSTLDLIYDGMSGDVTLIQEQARDVLYLASQAVTTEGNKSYVLVKDGGTVKQVEVTTGFTADRYVEISSGLSEGDVVQVAVGAASSTGRTSDNTGRASGSTGGSMPEMPSGGMPQGGGAQ